ncbi:2-oxo acid dehydrogenase subunit E2 [Streptomyces sp. RB6PN25]|uniref:2-oxo acid dehydrogenase subunit E2 n=1 Tax=Streptomyces humicola TaxID=2953240 RepID=A0ABT1Q2X5_9ACTN|nr:2-oxo acid dehydrogenase subunit E2 [Streptomyces humicola]MCQ4084284.1 2-oxo acid dehydrogenase subunit E2 [Streptomyces humicola]
MNAVAAADRARRHTRYFLQWARSASPVHLAAEVDMSAIEAHRSAARAAGTRSSVAGWLVWAASRVMAAHPEANAAAAGLVAPRTVRYDAVHVKLAMDRMTPQGRCVRTAVLHHADRLEFDAIQQFVDRCRDGGEDASASGDRIRLLGRLPAPVGRLAFRTAMARTARRPELLGSVAVSSLGNHRADTFHAYGGTAVTLNAGRIAQRPVVRQGQVVAAPVMRLGMTFDHRVIDGAAAADVLDDLVHLLEGCDAVSAGGWHAPQLRPVGHRTAPGGDGPGRALAAGPRRPAGPGQRDRSRAAEGLDPRRPGGA